MKKIKYKDAAAIIGYKKPHPIKQACFIYKLEKDESNATYKVYEKASLWFCVLAFLPCLIFIFFCCLWDGGLKEFFDYISNIHIPTDNWIIYDDSKYYGDELPNVRYKKAEKIYNRG